MLFGDVPEVGGTGGGHALLQTGSPHRDSNNNNNNLHDSSSSSSSNSQPLNQVERRDRLEVQPGGLSSLMVQDERVTDNKNSNDVEEEEERDRQVSNENFEEEEEEEEEERGNSVEDTLPPNNDGDGDDDDTKVVVTDEEEGEEGDQGTDDGFGQEEGRMHQEMEAMRNSEEDGGDGTEVTGGLVDEDLEDLDNNNDNDDDGDDDAYSEKQPQQDEEDLPDELDENSEDELKPLDEVVEEENSVDKEGKNDTALVGIQKETQATEGSSQEEEKEEPNGETLETEKVEASDKVPENSNISSTKGDGETFTELLLDYQQNATDSEQKDHTILENQQLTILNDTETLQEDENITDTQGKEDAARDATTNTKKKQGGRRKRKKGGKKREEKDDDNKQEQPNDEEQKEEQNTTVLVEKTNEGSPDAAASPLAPPTSQPTTDKKSQADKKKGQKTKAVVATTSKDAGAITLTPRDESKPTATVAYAISLIKCGDKQSTSAGLVDAALVMRHSIHLQSWRNPESGSKYDYNMYAIVHRDAVECSSVLENAGFTIVVKDPPIQPSEIKGDHLKNSIHKEWCCGHDEFVKLYAYDLPGKTNDTEPEPIVVHVDIDFAFFKPMDNLYDAILFDKDSPQGKAARDKIPKERKDDPIPDQIDAFITRDYPQLLPSRIPGYQAGFLVARRDPSVIPEVLDVVREGNYVSGFSRENGWGGKGYGGYVGVSVHLDQYFILLSCLLQTNW